MKQRVKIGLNCIVKNESKVIERMLQSAIGLIDCYYILDTGSTDGTPDIIRNFFKKHNIQGEVVVDTDCHQEINGKKYFMYDRARNKALRLLKGKCDFGVHIDADEQFKFTPQFNINTLKNNLVNCDRVSLTVEYNESRYLRNPIFRVSKPFEWRHPVHEYLHCKENTRDLYEPNISCLVTSDGASWTAESMKEKYLGHATILEWAVQQNNDPRDIFYCANSYKDAGEHAKAIEWYEKRVARTDGYDEERFYAQLMIAEMKSALQLDSKEIFFEYMKAADIDNMKAENFINAIILLQGRGNWELAYIVSKYCVETYHKKSPYPKRSLFLDAGTYEWKLLAAHKINCQRTGRGDYINLEELDKMSLDELLDSIPSAWKGHKDFCKWLIQTINPKLTVELGVDYGYSLFCLAVGNKGKVYGIDSFKGDAHTGFRDTSETVLKYNTILKTKHNMRNIEVFKANFNDFKPEWTGKIDIIHIDGSPLEVENDYNKWLPLMSNDGVILFHDTASFSQVTDLFNKIDLPKINFQHSGGLGIVSKNKNIIDKIRDTYFISTPIVEINYEPITIGYIAHNNDVYQRCLKPSLDKLSGTFDIVSTSDEFKPAKNYNDIIDRSKTKYILLVHEDVTFSPDLLRHIHTAISINPNFGAIGAVGTDNGAYHWGEVGKIKEIELLDCCCILINKEHGIRFDDKTFDEYHLYVEDYCKQVINKGMKVYTMPINASEAQQGIGYEQGVSYFKHHSHTVNQRGYCWGRYYEYLDRLKAKWDNYKPIGFNDAAFIGATGTKEFTGTTVQAEVDICFISYAKTIELKKVTETAIESLLVSEDNIKFNIFVLESNKDVSYDLYPNTTTLRTDEKFCYNRYLNIAASKGKAPYVFLANNDLTFERGWATEIIKQMTINPTILSASPFCPQTQDSAMKAAPVIQGYGVREQLAGWAIFVQRRIFDLIDWLPTDCNYWFSDNDYSMTLQSKKIIHALITNSVVNHHDGNHGKTGNLILQDPALMDEYTNGQLQIFKKKWNLI